jgi:hypothetical protein
MAVAAAIGLLIMVTPLRAAVVEWLRLGAVTLLIGPTQEPTLLPVLRNLLGGVTLEEAQANTDYTLQAPRTLGQPDHVYQQHGEFNTVIMVWDEPAVSLYQIGPEGEHYMKLTHDAQRVMVNGYEGAWVLLPHVLEYERDGVLTQRDRYLVPGPVLIWYAEGITYRLETGMELDEALAIAATMGTIEA